MLHQLALVWFVFRTTRRFLRLGPPIYVFASILLASAVLVSPDYINQGGITITMAFGVHPTFGGFQPCLESIDEVRSRYSIRGDK